MINHAKIKTRMSYLGLTYDDVAENAEMSRSTVIKIIRNPANPTHDSICRIAKVLEIKEEEFIEYFFDGVFDNLDANETKSETGEGRELPIKQDEDHG